MWKWCTVLLLLALPPSVNSKETPTPRMCAVCLEKDCANGVTRIYPVGSDTPVWVKENSQDGIQNCCMENLKADAPCKMANGSLVQPADNPLQFEGNDSSGGGRIFKSQILSCAELGQPSSPKLSPATRDTSSLNPSPNLTDSTTSPGPAPVTGNYTIAIVSACILVAALIVAGVGGLIYKKRRNRRGQGQDKDHRHGNNGVPPHDAEHRDENTMEKQPFKGGIPNGNVNGVHREDDSVGTAGLHGHCDDTPV